MPHDIENEAPKALDSNVAKARESEDSLRSEVSDALTKPGNEGTFRAPAAAQDATNKALPSLEIADAAKQIGKKDNNIEDSLQGMKGDPKAKAALEEMRKDPNGGGGGGRVESRNSMKGNEGDPKAQAELEELRKDPHGKGGGGKIEMKDLQKGSASSGSSNSDLNDSTNSPAGGSSGKGGKFEEGTSQSGRGQSGGGKGLEMPKQSLKDVGPQPNGAKAIAGEEIVHKMQGLKSSDKVINKK